MDPYAKPKERKVGGNRPKIAHLPAKIDKRTPQQRRAEKQAVAAERRAIKKSAHQHLKQELLSETETAVSDRGYRIVGRSSFAFATARQVSACHAEAFGVGGLNVFFVLRLG